MPSGYRWIATVQIKLYIRANWSVPSFRLAKHTIKCINGKKRRWWDSVDRADWYESAHARIHVFSWLDSVSKRIDKLSEEATLWKLFCAASEKGSTLKGKNLLPRKERICSPWSKFFPFRIDSILEAAECAGKQTGSHKSCLPWKRWREIYHVCLVPLIWVDKKQFNPFMFSPVEWTLTNRIDPDQTPQWSGSTLFAFKTGIAFKYGNTKN